MRATPRRSENKVERLSPHPLYGAERDPRKSPHGGGRGRGTPPARPAAAGTRARRGRRALEALPAINGLRGERAPHAKCWRGKRNKTNIPQQGEYATGWIAGLRAFLGPTIYKVSSAPRNPQDQRPSFNISAGRKVPKPYLFARGFCDEGAQRKCRAQSRDLIKLYALGPDLKISGPSTGPKSGGRNRLATPHGCPNAPPS